MKQKSFLDMYLECVEADVVGPDVTASDDGDTYARGDRRVPEIFGGVMTRRGLVTPPANQKKKKKKKSSWLSQI